MANPKKKKILWVVYGFVQAGGERYVYEICKALKKDKYEVDVLHVNPLGAEKAWKSEYYYQPTLNCGCGIIDLQELLEKNRIPQKNVLQRAIRFLKKKTGIAVKHYLPTSQYLLNFLNEYDYVNFSGTAVFKTLCIDRNIYPGNAIIHILTAQFQVAKDLFEGYNKSLKYHFVSSIPEKSQRRDLQKFDNYRLTYFPLCFETKPYEIDSKQKVKDHFKIAVFTRLSAMKPLDPYFYALKLLNEHGINVVLEIFGAGNPEQLGLIRQLDYLHIRDRVFFMGHTESIEETLKNEEIDLIWYQSNNAVPAGYAALEVSMSGVPQIFWDFAGNVLQNPIEKVFPSFTSLTAFVNYTRELLISKEVSVELGAEQRNYVCVNNCSKTHIHLLEELFNQ